MITNGKTQNGKDTDSTQAVESEMSKDLVQA